MASKPPVPASSALWNKAVADHQAGRLKEAEAVYRQVLAATPQHFDAKHLLGVVALQSGRLDEAATLIGEALAINPKLAAAHNNLGNVRLRQGRDADAKACFQKAVQLQPSFTDAHYNLGNLLRAAGQRGDAVKHYQRAVAGNAKWYEAQQNLGATLFEMGDAKAAVRHFEAAARLKPDRADAASNLAAALADAGEMQRALDAFARALVLNPNSAAALANQGGVLARMGRSTAARQSLEQALRLAPRDAGAHLNLGTLLRETGAPAEALTHFERAIEIDPALLDARTGRSLALHDLGRDKEAQEGLAALQRSHAGSIETLLLQARLCMDRNDRLGAQQALSAALQAQPANAEAQHLSGILQALGGQWKEAQASYQRAIAADPAHARARWALAMAQVPPVADAAPEVPKARAAFARMLSELDRWFDAGRAAQGHAAVGSTQPFYLAYEAVNQRELLQKYGALCARLMAPWQRELGLAARPVATHLPLRIGIASAHLRDHSVWNAVIKGWVRHLDKARFQLYLYHLGTASDAQTEEARRLAHRLATGPRDASAWARQIAEDAIDVMIYPEIGMDATTTRLAAMRLAPVQAAAWGHPQTTGLPTIDHYLSAADLEPPDAAAHYSEKLVALPGLGVCYDPVPVASVVPDLAALGLPLGAPLLLCPGVPFKYAPAQDRVWVEIARRAPACRLVFFDQKDNLLGRQFTQRLARGFAAAGLDFAQHVVVLPFLDRARFHGLMKQAHLFLDTIGFSGFNTAMQAVECGLPVVAQEGVFMRGRLASAILRRLGLDELVVASDDAYIDLAVALAGDAARRRVLAEQIVKRRAMLFGDVEPVRALERFLEVAAAAVRPSP